MTSFWIRPTQAGDMDAIAALNDAAFGGPDEARITRRLHGDGDSLVSLVAVGESGILGHIEFFRIRIDGEPTGVGLGPMCAWPGLQRSGIGSYLVRTGLEDLDDLGETIVFVLGHPAYYPRFGFSAEAARPFAAPWSGPHFMAQRLREGAPASGTLTYPPAFS
ncbi:N-acetyltransferase [Hyphomonas sp.]|uniref:GNAT family N-acetyltransferase n=1 Tax=Hyphomonas sp. TaxID=87 RepID=UPI0025B96AEA|nr:N-acetyltransferase [Hyphomonas sp.]MBI1401331.1 GNAT family N-acetyltransferase [Hyphomonas sp.]